DGSTDGTKEMIVREFPTVSIVFGTGLWWWTRSINEGIRFALHHHRPDYFLLLNDDSQIKPGYLETVLQEGEAAGPNCITASFSVTDEPPYRVSFSGVKAIDWVRLKKQSYYRSFEALEQLPTHGSYPTYALNGRGTLIPAPILLSLGLLDEKTFPQYGSDDDLALRAWKKGYKVMLSCSCVIYDSTRDTSKGAAFRRDPVPVFMRSFFTWHSVNYIPKQARFFYRHGIKILLPYYLIKFLAGTCYAYFIKYAKTTP
ncbi:MAG TPA: glycosyltransferase, partial [Bacteroidia bacterium]|nr:glycosyltransferase [Bacteroidia bacterium]